jgi:signal transduction histidine kinase/CheY-like chemotaxis protein
MTPMTTTAPSAARAAVPRQRPRTWTWVIVVALALAAGWAAQAAWRGAAAAPDAPVVLRAAEMAPGAARAPATWRPVALPDTWAHHKLGATGRARYRAAFELADAPAGVWGLRIDRLSSHHEVRVNGTLLRDTLGVPTPALRRPVPALIALPGGLLRAGVNTIDIEVDHGARGGLSPLLLGPLGELEPGFLSGHHRESGLPQWLNIASVGACLVALVVWWRRRGEVALGAFAALGLLASLRNLAYYEVESPLPPTVLDIFFFLAQVASIVLLGLFAMAVSGRTSRRLRAAWVGGGALLAAVGAAAAAGGWMQQARAWVYPLLLAAMVGALWLLAQAARRLSGRELLLPVVGLAAVAASGLHDYLYQQGHTSVMDSYWLPYAVPLAVLAFAALLVRRIVDAMHGVELANLTLEQRVRERTAALEHANAAKGRFVAAASHDLRQPVAAIGLLVGLLRERVDATLRHELVDRIDRAVAALESLLKGLLDLSRLDAGTVRPRLGPVALQPLFDAIAAHEGAAAQTRGIALRFRPTPLAVVTDALLLEQMLRNLVGNALRCTAHGGVLVAARRRGERVLLQVWDTGCGMTTAQQTAAFEEFVQFHDGTDDGGPRGLGLGLAIVQRSARLLGHALTLRSVPGRGSCFGLELPRERRSARDARAGAAPQPAPLAGRHLVVVDDEAPVRDALRLRLEGWGAAVSAYDGLAALRAAHAAGVSSLLDADLLLTDHRLTDGDGLAVVAWLRSLRPGAAALVVTGSTLPGELARLAGAGVPLLNKPFREQALLDAVQALLDDRP